MKTAEQIVNMLDETINSLLKRPLMYVADPISLEGMALTLMSLYASSMNGNAKNITGDWMKYTKELLGDIGNLSTASYMQRENMMTDNYGPLSVMLNNFYNSKIKNN